MDMKGRIAMEETELRHVNVFVSGTGGYFAYRIPAIETAPDGSLLAFAEARKYNLNDPGYGEQEIDLVMKRSTDNGASWSDVQVIEAPGECWSAANAATITDRDSGTVWLIYLRCRPGANTGTARPGTDDIRVLARSSEDCGVSWSRPMDLTEASRDISDDRWRCTVPGPGGAIQDRQGRLVIPCWMTEPRRTFVVFSEDHGTTWQRGEPMPGDVPGSEDQVVELADGRLLMDVRQRDGARRRFAESTNGGRTWGMPRPGLEAPPVACAIKRISLADAGDDRDRIAWTGPAGPGRRNLVARVSTDEGRTFGPSHPVRESMAAYSDLTVLADGSLGILWESGPENPYEFLTFTRLTREFLDRA